MPDVVGKICASMLNKIIDWKLIGIKENGEESIIFSHKNNDDSLYDNIEELIKNINKMEG